MNEVYINMPIGDGYGWGICGKNLVRELSNKTKVNYIDVGYEQQIRDSGTQKMVDDLSSPINSDVGAPFIHTLDREFKSKCEFRGSPNIGYIFHEEPDQITEEQVDYANNRYDKVVAGSEWTAKILRDKGIESVSIPQGVDRAIFHPGDNPPDDKFIIFSGGKWEHRKGQDIVIKAVAEAQKTYPDIILVASWVNLFNENGYLTDMRNLMCEAGLKNFQLLPILSQSELARVMRKTHIGIFPNRVESGTNLVLMEYLACGKPVIANPETGQRDMMKQMFLYAIADADIVSNRIRIAYELRDGLSSIGKEADKAMDNFTWDKMAERFLELM